MPNITHSAPTPDQFLGGFPAEVQALAGQLRALIKQTVPGVAEAVYTGWKLIGYRAPDGAKSRYFCFIAPLPGHVKLGFEYGALMTNDAGLLEGNGSQVRYVTLAAGSTFDAAALAALIAEGAMVAATARRAR